MKLLYFLVIVLFITGCDPEAEKPREITKKHIAWCENICMETVFNNLHSKGESWGTGSSSLDGFSQDNTFMEVKSYCSDIYSKGCYHVGYRDDATIHRDPHYGGGITNTADLP